ncbi:Sporulation related domain-containing protein [Collimonas sp. OK307]|uniref:SPOR domain-containing protein n=1 Tax=Collimonas sp. OK307 TaxID=1801620 RepID=UPI0008E8525A|nr:SPOR domain-containing protein [Collimonas sp. OK307]SFH86123.1 Sporulation related domain-containing protein [Collimonas sp. OK307]
MLKIIFWLLILANATLFAMQKGYLGALYSDGREPTRISKQLQADKIKMTVAEAASAAVASTEPLTPATAAADPAPVVACTEIGNFAAAEARRFSSKLAERAPNVKFVRRETQEVASHMVYLPSLGSKEAADKKADEIRRLGISDFFVIQDSSALRYGISLGIFKTDEAAQKQVASLAKRGLGGAKVGTRTASSSKVAFQLRDLGGDAKIAFDKIRLDFPGQEVRSCPGP